MGPFGAFQEITDHIPTNPPCSGEGGSALLQPAEPGKPGKRARAGVRLARHCSVTSAASPCRTWQVGSITTPV